MNYFFKIIRFKTKQFTKMYFLFCSVNIKKQFYNIKHLEKSTEHFYKLLGSLSRQWQVFLESLTCYYLLSHNKRIDSI